jgi:CheY-like chemotaxis protein
MREANIPRLIYVVDDEPTIANTLAMILETQGLATRSFTHPLAALTAARSVSPDLLLSDVIMPEMTGVELAIAMRQSSPHCRVLLLSGQAATVDLLEAARAEGHFFEVLAKPSHPLKVIETVKRLLDTESAAPR